MVSGCGSKTEAAVASVPEEPAITKTDSSLLQKAFVKRCNALEITPVDESATDTSLLRFIIHLKKIVSQKNTIALLDLIGPDMVSSHGGLVIGRKDFIENWDLQKNPSTSAVWSKLERALKLGGCFDKKSKEHEFVMPYLQAAHYFDHGCDFEWFNTYVCLSSYTKIYGKPDRTGKVIAELYYRILESDADAKAIGSFIPVHTVDRSVEGYVHEDDVYLCADYMLVISKGKNEDAWSIKEFIPYD